MSQGPYDLLVLRERASHWRAEAAAAASDDIRACCLTEAERYETRIHRSLSTPVLLERPDHQGVPASDQEPVFDGTRSFDCHCIRQLGSAACCRKLAPDRCSVLSFLLEHASEPAPV
jgi:hypothetical protein